MRTKKKYGPYKRHPKRPRYIITRSADMRREEIVALWYDWKRELLCVGGPLGCSEFGKVIGEFLISQLKVKLVSARLPLRIRGNWRWLIEIPATLSDFEEAVRLLRDEWSDGVTIKVAGPLERFGRLTW